jgi:hypothetical protein
MTELCKREQATVKTRPAPSDSHKQSNVADSSPPFEGIHKYIFFNWSLYLNCYYLQILLLTHGLKEEEAYHVRTVVSE